ncbi:MAG: (2Fe-2S)-binding protein [Cutibacterium acnes]|nr:MAG: (2Fe-2S)-binding protein [Cutibacterium acnes]
MTRQREAFRKPSFRGVGTRQECTPDLAAGAHNPATKNPDPDGNRSR